MTTGYEAAYYRHVELIKDALQRIADLQYLEFLERELAAYEAAALPAERQALEERRDRVKARLLPKRSR